MVPPEVYVFFLRTKTCILHSPFEKIKKYVKDRTGCFDDYYTCMKKKEEEFYRTI
jgi:hypothetical protein